MPSVSTIPKKQNSTDNANIGDHSRFFAACAGIIGGFVVSKWYFSKYHGKKEEETIFANKYRMDEFTSISKQSSSNSNDKPGKDYLSLMTLNVWRPYPEDCDEMKNQSFDQSHYNRKQSLIEFFNLYSQTFDIFALQECNKDIINLLKNSCNMPMISLKCDKDDKDNMGKSIQAYKIVSSLHNDSESVHIPKTFSQNTNNNNNNIYGIDDRESQACVVYNSAMYDCIEGGCFRIQRADVGFARLIPKQSNIINNNNINYHIIVVSIHLSFPGTQNELATGQSPRVAQLNSICDYIENNIKLNKSSLKEIVFICGDFNDHFHSAGIAMTYGYQHCFYDCDRLCSPSTFPSPAVHCVELGPDPQSATTYDWIFCQNKKQESMTASKIKENIEKSRNLRCKGVLCKVVKYNYFGIYPSDHYPVSAVYCIEHDSK